MDKFAENVTKNHMVNRLDKTNIKIIKCLKRQGSANQTELFRNVFAREGQKGWTQRLQNLKNKKVITITKNKSGRSTSVELTKKWK